MRSPVRQDVYEQSKYRNSKKVCLLCRKKLMKTAKTNMHAYCAMVTGTSHNEIAQRTKRFSREGGDV